MLRARLAVSRIAVSTLAPVADEALTRVGGSQPSRFGLFVPLAECAARNIAIVEVGAGSEHDRAGLANDAGCLAAGHPQRVGGPWAKTAV